MLVAFSIVTVGLAHALFAASSVPELTASPRGDPPIVIDGVLDEPAWLRATPGRGFVERTPVREGGPPVETEFRVLFDEKALYVGVEMGLESGEVPRAFERRRDNFRIFSDDTISLKFDVRRDKRATIGFVVNAAGARMDYVSVDRGDFRVEFDVVWDVEVRVTETAWFAEFRIPVLALGLPDREGERVLGLNLSRDHNLRVATYDWSFLPPELGPTYAERYGVVRGVEGVVGGRPLTLIPFATAGYRRDDRSRFPADTPWTVSGGGDVRMRLGEDSWLEATVLTDFAQVDLDDQQVNLDRFPLFFPEKRPFFLTGLDVFEFGDEGGAQQFFSRRIGLDENALEVPLYFGAKSYGRSGRLRFGVLDVVTGDSTTNWGVGRLRYNFGETSYVGALLTSFYDFEAEESETGIGLDATYRGFDERLQLSSFVATLIGDDGVASRETSAGNLSVAWRGEHWRPQVSSTWVGPDYTPRTGFVRRTGVSVTELSVPYVRQATRKERLGGLREWEVRPFGGITTDDDFERTVLRNAGGEGGLRWRNGVAVSTYALVEEDVVDDAFALPANPDVRIEADTYRSNEIGLGAEVSSQNNPFGSVSASYNDGYFGGERFTADGSAGVAFGPWVRLSAGVFAAWLDLPAAEPFVSTAVNSTVSFTPNTTVLVDVTGQWNTTTEQVSVLSRFRWRFRPGSDLFVVYRDRYGEDRTGVFAPGQARSVIAKLVWRFDALL